jgi:hypothetical protein
MALEAPSYEVASTFSSPNNAASAKLPANTTVVVVADVSLAILAL